MAFNTPTLFNSFYSFRFGWAGNARTMHDEVYRSLRMALLDNGAAAQRLATDRVMTKRFRAIYRAPPTENLIVDALTAFMNTLVTPGAPFDRWQEGDANALTRQQVHGYKLFVSLGCASCHQGQNIGANIMGRRGVFHPLGDHLVGDPAPRTLRVPSLRNVAITAPYFHDGSVSSLTFAVREMAWSQLDRKLSDHDSADITAFLRSLTGSYKGSLLRPAARHRR
jgi:cytochrome c peroxidase